MHKHTVVYLECIYDSNILGVFMCFNKPHLTLFNVQVALKLIKRIIYRQKYTNATRAFLDVLELLFTLFYIRIRTHM